APPLFLPADHGFTQNGPEPTSANDVRPFSLQLSCANAAFEPMPRPFGCGPIPGPLNDGGGAAHAFVVPRMPSKPRLTNTATARTARRDFMIPPCPLTRARSSACRH